MIRLRSRAKPASFGGACRLPRRRRGCCAVRSASDLEREMVLGDLQEQLADHGARWYWRQALAISAHALTRRSADRRGRAERKGEFLHVDRHQGHPLRVARVVQTAAPDRHHRRHARARARRQRRDLQRHRSARPAAVPARGPRSHGHARGDRTASGVPPGVGLPGQFLRLAQDSRHDDQPGRLRVVGRQSCRARRS